METDRALTCEEPPILRGFIFFSLLKDWSLIMERGVATKMGKLQIKNIL